ncbi:MAG: hypothetical protein U0798_10445 [Gemmataceae bacterium]
MAKVRGTYRKMSLARSMICDFLSLSKRVPLAHGERKIALPELRAAVAACRPRPQWVPIFFKAYSIVAAARPALRRTYIPYPWPRFYEYPKNLGACVIARQIDGDEGLINLVIPSPETWSIADLDREMKEARLKPLWEVSSFRRQIRTGKLPWPLRQLVLRMGDWSGLQKVKMIGTFGMSCTASLGLANISTWFPWSSMIHFTPFEDDDTITLRIGIDHRVFDGVEAAFALREMEQALNTVILDEVKAMAGDRLKKAA